MARRRDGGRGSLRPGLSAALAARVRRMDAAFCMGPLGAPCHWCELAAAYDAGEPVHTQGTRIWEALYDDRHPHEWREFMNDEVLYIVTGDRVERAQDVGDGP